MAFSGSGVLCRKNGVREELTYSFDAAGEVGRRVLLQLFHSILVFFILMIAVYELGENTQCCRS